MLNVCYQNATTNTVMVTLSHHRFKMFLFLSKKELRINNAQVCCDLFINKNLTYLNYSLLKNLKSEKNGAAKTTWQIFRWFIHIKETFFFVKKERTIGKSPPPSSINCLPPSRDCGCPLTSIVAC